MIRKRIITTEEINNAINNRLKLSPRVSKMPSLYNRKDEYSKAVVKMKNLIRRLL